MRAPAVWQRISDECEITLGNIQRQSSDQTDPPLISHHRRTDMNTVSDRVRPRHLSPRGGWPSSKYAGH